MWSTCLTLFLILPLVYCHSQMTEPLPQQPFTCRKGGEPQFGVETCPGPCDPDFPPTQIAGVYQRDQYVQIKYQRNNHAPGGFIRLTLVPPRDMMNKDVHSRNAFHYSCWGARTQVATQAELTPVNGVSLIGSDGMQHSLPPAYYTTTIKIPPVVPDGDYVLGWAWFGGIGQRTSTPEVENQNPSTIEPHNVGYFSDYWACSKVRIRGGPMRRRYTPVFVNDMRRFSNKGCMSANDALGVCTYEPCFDSARYRKPRKFRNGTPQPITPNMFGRRTLSKGAALSACRCLGKPCSRGNARRSGGRCQRGLPRGGQSRSCTEGCCDYCASNSGESGCRVRRVRNICGGLR